MSDQSPSLSILHDNPLSLSFPIYSMWRMTRSLPCLPPRAGGGFHHREGKTSPPSAGMAAFGYCGSCFQPEPRSV